MTDVPREPKLKAVAAAIANAQLAHLGKPARPDILEVLCQKHLAEVVAEAEAALEALDRLGRDGADATT